VQAPERTAPAPDVVIVGAGPVGLTAALDLGRRGRRVVVANKLDFIAAGSKAICFSKRTLDVWHRLGVGEAMTGKGVIWNVGKVFWGDDPEPIYQFDMLPVKQQKMPGFINLQQYYVEEILVQALLTLPNVELRWGQDVVGVEQEEDGVRLKVIAADRQYELQAPWVIACDGSRSPLREMMGLDFEGRLFEDNFLIADIKVQEARPSERWFWFDPPFNRGQSALFHRQPDNVWRLDFQLGWEIDRASCVLPENVEPLVRGMLGNHVEFESEWYSVYTFQCRRMARFVHGRVIFAGDSAHLVSPFGARGCNGGIADVDNLVWKLDLVMSREARMDLIQSYEYEAGVAADENILNSSRSTDFMTPKTAVSRAFRDAVLELAKDHSFARPFVNSGRLSTAVDYPASPLSTNDECGENWDGIRPGAVALDAPLGDGWLLDVLAHGGFTLLTFESSVEAPSGIRRMPIETRCNDCAAIINRYDLQPGSAYLIRPDQYVAARWRNPTREKVRAAFEKARGLL
jgi:3-(3-hydroxy-phenyl)propionate hydroxylase